MWVYFFFKFMMWKGRIFKRVPILSFERLLLLCCPLPRALCVVKLNWDWIDKWKWPKDEKLLNRNLDDAIHRCQLSKVNRNPIISLFLPYGNVCQCISGVYMSKSKLLFARERSTILQTRNAVLKKRQSPNQPSSPPAGTTEHHAILILYLWFSVKSATDCCFSLLFQINYSSSPHLKLLCKSKRLQTLYFILFF